MIRYFIALAVLLFGSFASANAETYPKHVDFFVNDLAGLLTIDDETDLRRWLVRLQKDRGIEFTVLTIDSMRDYGHSGQIEPYATALFNAWGIGLRNRNDGVLLLVARKDRQMRIELGAGYTRDRDGKMQGIIDTTILPAFRKDDYRNGIRDGVAETIRSLTGSAPIGFQSNAPSALVGWISKFFANILQWIFMGIMFLLAIFGRGGGSSGGSSNDSSGGSFGGGSSSGGGASGRW